VLILLKIFVHEPSGPAFDRLESELAGVCEDYQTLCERHAAIHRELFLRVRLDLGGQDRYRNKTNQKLVNMANYNQALNALFEKMFDFGRYALICSSGTQGMPAHLQGIWGGEYGPPWGADYHTDMNIQMNYFQALAGNMAEITLPFFDYYESLLDDFRANARDIAGCRGILAPMGGTSHGLASLGWSYWTAAAGWLAQLFYDYWLFTGDQEFLRKRAVPFLKETALFYEDFLVEGADGRYIFIPSMSPENVPSNSNSTISVNATMDLAVCREVLTNLTQACSLLGIEDAGVERWNGMLAKLPPYLLNEEGAIKEWAHPDFEDNYTHRHLSHLYPVFPGIEVTKWGEPELFQACRIAMKRKMEELEYACCWSYVYAASAFARLGQGDEALKALEIVARGYELPNLFTTLWLHHHLPPMMQFEAASGIPAAIMEMLLYSEPGMLSVLPALPSEWPTGNIRGLRARGGFEVDIFWDKNKLASATIRSLTGNACVVRCGDMTTDLPTKAGESYRLDGSLNLIVS
jgi:alpha-L-fucosidase 2